MTVQTPAGLGIIFVALAVVFLGITVRDYLNTEGKMTIARKIWLRMVFIFAGVSIGIYFITTFMR